MSRNFDVCPTVGGRWVLRMTAGSMARSGSMVPRYFVGSVVCTEGLSTVAQSS
jgi:hypothetical protein